MKKLSDYEEEEILSKQYGKNARPKLIPIDPTATMTEKINQLIAANCKPKEPVSFRLLVRNVFA